MSPRIVYFTDPASRELCPRCGREPCVCQKVDLAPNQQTAYVQRDRKRRAGKTVTLIWGLQHNPAVYKALLKTLQTTCGTGGTFKDGEIEIQGDHRDRVAEKLKEMGYKVKMVGG
jgi:translation initiation factor 1